MTGAFEHLQAQLQLLQERGLYRQRRVLESAQGVEVRMEGRRLLNFSSNDYLGLANHPQVVQAAIKGMQRYGVGSGSAHLLCGHSHAHHALEEELADFTGRDRALLFSTGYMANLGVITALLGKGDAVFEDRLNHASLLDGGLYSGARFKRYPHGDSEALTVSLEKTPAENRLIVSDGVFSMDGDLAPLPELARVAAGNQAWLMVDDAHGLGVLGDKGSGSCDHFGLTQRDAPVLMATLGKAFGTFGAFVAGSEELIETLIQKARTYIYTTAMPASLAEAGRMALRLVMADDWRRDRLAALTQRFTEGARQLGLQLPDSRSAIHVVVLGDSQRAVSTSEALLHRGIVVGAIRPPTVPRGTARLRITFSAEHRFEHVDRLLDALEKILL